VHGCQRLPRQQFFDRGNEIGAAFSELGSFLDAWRCRLVVAFLAGGFRAA
jgi:hypothetical protein